MLTRPTDLDDADLRRTLKRQWGITAAGIEYLPVGFGSYHWSVFNAEGEHWFVTVDDLEEKAGFAGESPESVLARLRAALTTARKIYRSGRDFVVAPIPAANGAVVNRLCDRFGVAVYPYIDGRSHPWGEYESRSDRRVVLQILANLHSSPETILESALRDDFGLPHRDELQLALTDLQQVWTGGPYAERARTLLSSHAREVEKLLTRYDQAAERAGQAPERMVLTHGEPHLANTMRTASGWRLIDWDTTLIAPPERDIWFLAGDRSILNEYETITGRAVLSDMLDFYRLKWDLTEIAIYISLFRRPHAETADMRESWENLSHYLDPQRWGTSAK